MRQIKLTAAGSRRGVALMLVMIAVVVSTIVAYSYLTGQGTSIGIALNINAHARARYIAESGMDMALAAIQTNGNWRSTYSHGSWVVDAPLLGGTVTVQGHDGKDVNGDDVIAIPAEGDGDLADDPADPATLIVTGRIGGVAHKLRAVLTPTPGGAIIVYGEQNQSYVRYRTRSGSSWSSEQSANTVGNNPKWYVAKYCPTRTETALCTLNNANDIYLQFWNGSAWTSASMMLTGDAGISSERPFDIAYEHSSGDLLVAYRASNGGTLRYRTATGTSNVSAEMAFTLPTTGNLRWVRLVPKPAASEVVVLTIDNKKDVATAVWNGNAWGNSLQLESSGKTAGNEQITGAYEGQSGRALVAWSENALDSFRYRIWNGSSWLPEGSGPALPREPQWLKLAADPMSNQLVMASLDGSSSIVLSNWDGSSWGGAPLMVETNSPGSDRRTFDVAFEPATGRAIAVWGRSNQNNFFYRTWNGSAWSAEQSGPGLTDKVSFAQLVSGGSGSEIYLTVLQKGSGAIQSFVWNGLSFGAGVQLETNASGPNNTESFMVAVPPAGSSADSAAAYSIDWRN